MTAEIILRRKGSKVHTVKPDDTVMHAANSLDAATVGAVVVSEDGEHIDGILSERDIVRALADRGEVGLKLPASEIMTREVKTCSVQDRAISIMGMMNRHGIGHVPVTQDGKMVGLISIGDIIQRRLDEVEADAKAMREYITGA